MVTKEEAESLISFMFFSLLTLAKLIKPLIELVIGLIMIPLFPIQFIWWLCTHGSFFEVGIYGAWQRLIDKIFNGRR